MTDKPLYRITVDVDHTTRTLYLRSGSELHAVATALEVLHDEPQAMRDGGSKPRTAVVVAVLAMGEQP